jgi:hypothetical protein
VRLVAEPTVRDHIEEHGGAVFVWPHRYRCCRSSTWVLEAGTDRPDREFELVHAAGGFQLYATPGLVEPDELHLELDRRGKLRAYWNGQGWIG